MTQVVSFECYRWYHLSDIINKTAFQVEYNCEYVYSKEDRDMLDGADNSTVTYELTPLKKGLFDIYEVEGFRCQETARKKHTIVVI